MKRGKIDKVAMAAKFAEQQSARELNVSRQNHQEKCDRLDQLVQFKQDYEVNLGSAGGEGMAAKQLQDYRMFLTRLSEAIDQQVKAVQGAEQSLEAIRVQWLSKSQRSSALEHLLEEQHRKLVVAREKAEQKEADESTLARSLSASDR